jgi:RNA polymerase sigma-70 factor (ECF subfamily)
MQNVKAFLYITTKNACLNFIKQSERNTKQQSELTYIHSQKEDHVLSHIIRAEVLREVHAAIETLPPQCRKIVRMSFVEGLKNQEIADRLNLSINTVKNHKMRAVSLLKIKLLSSSLTAFLVLYSHLADKN